MSRVSALNLSVAVAIGVVVSLDAAATPLEQHGLGLLTALLLGVCLVGAQAADRAVVLWCVGVSTVFELFFTQVWGLYAYRLGNVPLYVPAGHGLLCLVSLETARAPVMTRHRGWWTALIVGLALTWAGLGLFLSPHRDVEGALYLPIFLPLVLLTGRQLEHAWTFILASLVELVGTHAHAWEWAAVQPWVGVTSANPPSVAAGGYCTFTCLALGAAWLTERLRARAVALAREGASST
jgi:hypothetical protein